MCVISLQISKTFHSEHHFSKLVKQVWGTEIPFFAALSAAASLFVDRGHSEKNETAVQK